MTEPKDEWTAPDVAPLTEADGISTHPTAQVRNGTTGAAPSLQ